MLRDEDIREPLFEFLEERYGKVRIIEEKTMGKSRADLVMVMPEKLVGIEIKSDADSYVRLTSQVKDYDRYFDANIIVVGSTHAAHVAEHVPACWGIISAELEENVVDFYMIREMQSNPKRKMENKIKILWRPELAQIQEQNQLPAYKQKSKEYVRTVIVDRVPEDVLQIQISELLFERDYTKIEETLNEFRKQKEVPKPVISILRRNKRKGVRRRR